METLHSKILYAFAESDNSVYDCGDGKYFNVWKRELRNHDITCDVVNALDGVPQSTHYQPEFDALVHTFYVCRAVMTMGRTDLLETAFLHDYGKGSTTNIGDKRIYQFGHPDKSLEFIDQAKSYLKDYDLAYRLTKIHMNTKGKKTDDDQDFDDFTFADKVLSKELWGRDHNVIDRIRNKYREFKVHLKQRLSNKKVYIMVGISGSGKSRYLENVDPDYIVCPDDLRREISGDVSSQVDNSVVWGMVRDLMRLKLGKYGKVYLDATNVTKFSRVPLMARFNDTRKIAVVFDVEPDVAIARVHKDVEDGVDRSNVPDAVIRKQYKNFIRGKDSLKHEFNVVINHE